MRTAVLARFRGAIGFSPSFALQNVAVFVVVGVLYAGGAELSWWVFAAHIGFAFFPPAGLTLAALVLLPRRYWAAVLLAIWSVEIAVDRQHGLSSAVAVGYALANSLEPVVGALLLQRTWDRRANIDTRRGMTQFILSAVVAGPAAGALVGGATKALDASTSWPEEVAHFWAGDSLGVLAVGAAILALYNPKAKVALERIPEGLALLSATAVLGVLTFRDANIPPSMLVLPVLIWAAARFTSIGVAIVGATVAFGANLATAQGHGPFAAIDSLTPPSRLAVTQLFVATMILTAWFVAIEASERAEAITQQARERAARERAEALQGIGALSGSLLRSLSVDEVADIADHHARATLGASTILTLQPTTNDRTRFETFGSRVEEADPDGVVRRSSSFIDADVPTPGSDAARERRIVIAQSVEQLDHLYSDLASAYRASGVRSVIGIPLRDGLGVTGAIAFEFPCPQPFDDAYVALLVAFVDVVGQALERSLAHSSERRRLRVVERTSRLASGLASADTTQAVLDVVSELLPGLVEPANLTVVTNRLDGTPPRVVRDPTGAASHQDLPRALLMSLQLAMRTDQVVVLRGPQDLMDLGAGATLADWLGWNSLVAVPVSWAGRQFGGFAITLEPPLFLNETQIAQLQLVAEIIAQSFARAEAFEEHRIGRRFADALQESTDALAHVSPGLVHLASMASVVEQATAVLRADSAALFAVEGERVRVTNVHGGLRKSVVEWPDFASTDANPIVDAARSASMVVVPDEDAWADRYPHLRMPASHIAVVVVPLSRGVQNPDVVLALAFADPATLTNQTLRLLPFMAMRWVDQLDRASLAEREDMARSRLASLQLVTADLATARSEADLADAVTRGTAVVFGARHVALGAIELGAATPRAIGSTADFVDQGWIGMAGGPAAAAMHERRAIYVRSQDEMVTRFPSIAASAALAGSMGLAAVPLRSRRRTVGVLVLEFGATTAFGDLDTRLLESFADLCGQALERLRLADHEHQAALELQHAMLGEPDDVPWLVADFAYRPADRRLDVGGDWYDVIELPRNRIGLVVGDVVGHNVTAAATMGQLRSAVRALAPLIEDPGALVTQLESFVAGLDAAKSTTLMYAVFDPSSRTLRYHSAGHPPAMLVDDKGARFLEQGRGTPVGTIVRSRHTAVAVIPVGAALVMYTDGLVERRGESLDVGLGRLAAAVRELHQRAGWQCRSLVDAMTVGTEPRDDIAVLTIRPEVMAPTADREIDLGDSPLGRLAAQRDG